MDSDTWWNLALVLVFVLIGGVFAGTEFALVSLRGTQIDQLEQRGPRGRRVAAVARDPNRFLAAVQIGVTVAGFFSAAYGASTLAPDIAPAFVALGLAPRLADTVALFGLTILIAYLSLVLGELVPKRVALQRSAQFALVVGPPLERFSTLMRPVIWLLSRSTDAVVRLLGGDPDVRSEQITDTELRDLVSSHPGLDEAERRILDDVFAASERSVGEVMRPRGDVLFLPADMTVAQAHARTRTGPYSRYPVTGDGSDDVLGFVHVRDLALRADADGSETVLHAVREILEVPTTGRLLTTLSTMQRTRTHLALVVDEYGGTDGIVTLEDVLEELVGDIRDEHDPQGHAYHPGLHDAGLTIEDFARATGVVLPDGPYETVAGYVLAALGRLAEVGDEVSVEHDEGRSLTVTEVDDRRIRTVRLS